MEFEVGDLVWLYATVEEATTTYGATTAHDWISREWPAQYSLHSTFPPYYTINYSIYIPAAGGWKQ